MKNIFCGIAILAVALFAFANPGLAQEKEEAKTVYIGVAGPFTGSAAEFGDMIKKGSELAVAQANANGGINGATIELVFEDDQGKNDEAKIVAKKLAANRDISIVVGHFNSTCSLAGKEVYKQEGLVEFSPGSTNVTVCEGSDWTFRNLYRDDYQGIFLARYAKKVLEANKVAVFFDNDDYGIELKNACVKEAQRQGLEVVTESAYVREQTLDFSADLDKIAAASPDAIFIAGLYNEAGVIAQPARAKGLEVPFLAGDGVFSPGFLKVAGPAAEGTLITTPFLFTEEDEKAQQLKAAFNEKYGVDPDTWAALTYDAVNMAIDTMRKVGTDRKAIRDAFAAVNDEDKAFQGVTGPTYFDENGDCLKPAWVAEVKDGEFVPAAKQMK
jgi:branched-chain amino acid transport system substrate-binding protein